MDFVMANTLAQDESARVCSFADYTRGRKTDEEPKYGVWFWGNKVRALDHNTIKSW